MILEVVCWTIVAAWLILTVGANLPRAGTLVRRADSFDVLPAWTFFAPNPGTSDSIVLVQDVFPDGAASSWRVAWREHPSGLRMWWRPDKRVAKLVTDCCSSIRTYGTHGDVTLSGAYLLLAALVEAGPHEVGTTKFRFATAEVHGWWKGNRQPLLVYRSPEISLGTPARVP